MNENITVEKNAVPSDIGTHIFLAICIVGCIAFGVWAWTGELAIVSVAEGEVVPSTQVKTIQHLEGGIVREIKVREGERVKTGQSLVVLESTSTGADVGELKTRIISLKIEIARLQAAASNADSPNFPKDVLMMNLQANVLLSTSVNRTLGQVLAVLKINKAH
jgi:adhesin transport system membrane fusion protein